LKQSTANNGLAQSRKGAKNGKTKDYSLNSRLKSFPLRLGGFARKWFLHRLILNMSVIFVLTGFSPLGNIQ
jgi:hypothetical protein